jgi:hypothetical protein
MADTGGSNGYRCQARKTELQSQLADSFALAVTIAHYPNGAHRGPGVVADSSEK